jgi:type IV secretory pathway TraG/TraD family ATPase VirD4
MSIIGTTFNWGEEQPVALPPEDRRRHVYLIGQTGTGKTTLLRNLILQDIDEGRGVGFIDPHGDVAEELLDCIPPHRTDDVAYFNPADLEYPVGLNPLQKTPRDKHHLVVDSIISTLKSIWGDVWGTGRMQYVMHHTLSALLFYDHATFLGVNRLLSDPQFRKKILLRVKDPIVKSFWTQEFAALHKTEQALVVAPIQNKVGQFTTSPLMRNILGQTTSSISLRRTMDEGRIFIANLSKGKIGEENSRLLGSFLVAQFQLAAMQRADTGEEERRDFHLFIDEFQNFTTDSFQSILSEARKYRLCLALGHQYMAQLPESLRSAVFGNVGTMIALRVGYEDAEILADHFHPASPNAMAPHAFSDLAQHEAWARIMRYGEVSDPILIKTLKPLAFSYGRRGFLIQHSRDRFATRRAVMERKINQWNATLRTGFYCPRLMRPMTRAPGV